MSEGKTIKKLLEHDGRLDSIEGKLGSIEGRLDSIGGRLGFVEEQLQFMRENVVLRTEYLQGQDQIMVILKRLDEERLITHHTLEKLTAMVERHEMILAGG